MIPVASRMLCRPISQRIPIPTPASLTHPCVMVIRTIHERIVGIAHDVLPQLLETVGVVFVRPGSLGRALKSARQSGLEAETKDFL